jgi:glutathione S-transferase
MYRVHGVSESGNCYKVRLALEQLGFPYQWHEVDLLGGETRNPDFLALNPNGKVPVIELPDGERLTESNAILCYLAKDSPLLPEPRLEWARVLSWLFFEQYSHEPYIAVARFLLHFDHGMEVSQERLSMLHERGNQALGVMEKTLGKQDFFAGPRYSIADIALYAYTHVASDGGFDTGDYPAVSRWLERVAEHPGHFDMKDMPT